MELLRGHLGEYVARVDAAAASLQSRLSQLVSERMREEQWDWRSPVAAKKKPPMRVEYPIQAAQVFRGEGDGTYSYVVKVDPRDDAEAAALLSDLESARRTVQRKIRDLVFAMQ